jgi:hypothetical protein
MPNYTENYNLKKPLSNEYYSIEDQNDNMDIIDQQLKANADEINAHMADMATLRFSPEATEHANIFSLGENVVQGTMKGKLKGFTNEDCISVQPQEIKSVGKNLFSEQWRQGDVSNRLSNIRITTDNPIYVEKGKTYKVTSNNTSNYQVSFGFCLSRGGAVVQTVGWNVTEFIPDNDSWAYPVIRNAGSTAFTVQELINSGYKLQIEQGVTATPYEPYTESKAYLKYPLRSVPNGICDEVDLQSGKLTKRCKEYVLQTSDIAGIAPYTTLDYVQLNKPTDFVGYNNVLNYNASIIIPGFTGREPIEWDSALNIGGFFNQSAALTAFLGVPKGTYADLAAAQAAFAGTKIVYQLAEPEVVEDALSNQLTVYPSGTVYTQPYEAELEESTIPIIEHSEPINLAGAVKSESDRNTRQDEQINDITLLLDYLIVVNA